jgi:hypothetical protein
LTDQKGLVMGSAPEEPPVTGWQPRSSTGTWDDPDAPWTTGQLVQRATVFGLLWAVGTGLVLAALMSIDYFAWKHVPVEEAVVTTVSTDSTHRVACGGKPLFPNSDAVITTFHIDHPRPGYGDTLTVSGCGFDLHRGESVLLQRQPGGTEDDMMLGGPLKAKDMFQEPGMFAGVAFAAAFVWSFAGGVARRWWKQRAASRNGLGLDQTP